MNKRWIVIQYGDCLMNADFSNCIAKSYDTFEAAVEAAEKLYHLADTEDVPDDDLYSNFILKDDLCYGWCIDNHGEEWHVVVREVEI